MANGKIYRGVFGAFLFAAFLGLGACGGGGGGVSTVPNPNPNPSGKYSLESFTETLPPINDVFAPVDNRDREFKMNPGLDSVRADKAYDRSYFGQGTTIAIVELGFDARHPDLMDNMILDRDFLIPGEGLPGADALGFCERGYGGDVAEATNNLHGTYVALLAAGERNNNYNNADAGYIQVGCGNNAQNSRARLRNTHGVAPDAKILAVVSHAPRPREAFRKIVNSGKAHIVNNSFGDDLRYNFMRKKGEPGVWQLAARLPIFAPLLQNPGHKSRREFAETAEMLKNADMVFVWASGNNYWHSGGRINMCGKNHRFEDFCELSNIREGRPGGTDGGGSAFTLEEVVRDFELIEFAEENGVTVTNTAVNLATVWADGEVDYNDPGGWADAPLFEPDLLGKWLAVGSINSADEISDFSNGCGIAKNWCIMSQGDNLDIVEINGERRGINGTSFSAPIVSGALAVLKSRMPEMPMEVVLAVLLTSARDLGAPGVDDVYGWGAVDLERAMNLQNTVTLARVVETTSAPVLAQDLHIKLPSYLSHAESRLAELKTAAGGVGGAYVNLPLSARAEVSPAGVGGAAREMLRPAGVDLGDETFFAAADSGTNRLRHAGAAFSLGALGGWRLRGDLCGDCKKPAWREWDKVAESAAPFFAANKNAFMLAMDGEGARPFFAFGGGAHGEGFPWRQFGVRWRKEYSGFGIAAEMSHIEEPESFTGASFGAAGPVSGRTNFAELFLRGELSSDARGFLGFHVSETKARGGGVVREVRGLRSGGWSAGGEIKNMFSGGDMLRFGARQKTKVKGGAVLRLPEARGSFAEAFYNGAAQEISARDVVLDLSGGGGAVFALGYGARLPGGIRWSAAAEYDSALSESALSAGLRVDF